MLLHKHYLGAAHSFEILKPEDPKMEFERPNVTIIKTFYCNDTVNENDWQATWEGLKEDAVDLPGTPIVLKEDLEHPKFSVQDMYDRGTIFDYDIDEVNKQIIVYARITDLTIVERIKSGELQYVSPALIPRGSEYLKSVRGVDVLSRTLPIHLCIVSNPAYGKEKAKISHICSGDGKECYHRLKMMTAATVIIATAADCVSRKIEVLMKEKPSMSNEQAAAIAYSMCKEGTASDSGDGADGGNTGIQSTLKYADDGISALEQIPFIKKMIASTEMITSTLDKIHTGSRYFHHKGEEGRWIIAQDLSVFVARHQTIKEAMVDQCGCTRLAAMEDPEIESWITVRGNHIPIKKNQTKEEAVEEFLKDKEDKPKKKQMSDNEVIQKMHQEYPSFPEKTVVKNLEVYHKLEPKLAITKKHLEARLKKELPGKPVVSGRIKTPLSAVGKVAKKPKYADVSKLQDNVGMRAMYNDVTSVKEAMKVVREKYDIVEEDDYIETPKFDGYRSYHAIIIDKETGIESELQVRTQRQETFANWAHKFYKPEEDDLKEFVQTHEEMALKYQVDVGNYYSELDEGRKPKKPLCPKEILKLMMCL
jgi:ppGpp synthetase/RelA/SpoT-type nucleotidyltranferase